MVTLPISKEQGPATPTPEFRCIDGLTLTQQIGMIRPGPALDTTRYAYMAAPVTGDCLSERPAGPVFDGDSILFRELKEWKGGFGRPELLRYVGGLVAVSVRGQMMVKELDRIDFDRGVIWLRQYVPAAVRGYRLEDVLKLYVVDEVQRQVEFIA